RTVSSIHTYSVGHGIFLTDTLDDAPPAILELEQGRRVSVRGDRYGVLELRPCTSIILRQETYHFGWFRSANRGKQTGWSESQRRWHDRIDFGGTYPCKMLP